MSIILKRFSRFSNVLRGFRNEDFSNLIKVSTVQKNLQRNYPAPRKRFYKNVTIASHNGQYEVNLDQRKLKTPLGKLLVLPNEPLAIAVATEWDSQQGIVDASNMHITSLCNTALDNPSNRNKDENIDAVLEYLENDTLCYRTDYPENFIALQKSHWDPVLIWFQDRYNVEIDISESVNLPVLSEKTKDVLCNHLKSYDDWALLGILFMTENLKSLLLTQALVDRYIHVEKAVSLSRLELEYQINLWGNVDWWHDVDLLQLRARTAAGLLFTHLITETSHISQKIKRES